jgi:hypothetical protein
LKGGLGRLARYYVYFRRGHSGYLVLLVALANFVVIQYRLLVEYIPSLQLIFQSLTMFIIFFVLTYLPVTIIIGWLDYKRLVYPKEAQILMEANPYFHRLTAKEKTCWSYVVEAFKVLEKISEEKGLDIEKLKMHRKKVEKLLES